LLLQALTHRSYAHEQGEFGVSHNERLEFLGDAVLDLCVGSLLMDLLPNAREGQLTKLRAMVVSESGLDRCARKVKLGEHLLLGRGEEYSGGRSKPSILSDCYEAVIGAVFLDGGYTRADLVIRRLLGPMIKEVVAGETDPDYKGQLQELTQARWQSVPRYELVAEDGPDHDKHFEVSVSLDQDELARGRGHSKKRAEQRAARHALEQIRDEE